MGQAHRYGAFVALAAAGAIVALSSHASAPTIDGDLSSPTTLSAPTPTPAHSGPRSAPATVPPMTVPPMTVPPATVPPVTTAPGLVRPPTSVPVATTSTSAPGPTTDSSLPDGWRLVWSDEFDSFDPSKWSIERSTYGHGNGELQCYQASSVVVADGMLRLIATDQPSRCPRNEQRSFTSGMVRSAGLADWTYGRFEVRARFPAGAGLWPAAWLSPTHSVYGAWPRSGELDIVEALGHAEDRIVGSLHWMGPKGHRLANREYFLPPGNSFADAFHTFSIEWSPDRIVWFVDDIEYQRIDAWPSSVGETPAPFDQPFYLKLNLAVGGGAAGTPDATVDFPASYDVDWVRVYQR